MVQHIAHLADQLAARVIDGQADQIGVVVFVVGQVRQAITRGEQAHAFQGVGLFLGAHIAKAGGKALFDTACDLDVEGLAAVFGLKRRIVFDGFGIGRIAFDAHFAVHAKGAADYPYADHVAHGVSLRPC